MVRMLTQHSARRLLGGCLGGRVGGKIHIIDCKRLRIMGNLEKLEAMMEMMEEQSLVITVRYLMRKVVK